MKVLVIRLSSIGDIILTTPIVRCLSKQTNAEVHFLTKEGFVSLMENNAYVHRVHAYGTGGVFLKKLKEYAFDLVIDLHNNFRSRKIRSHLGVKSVVYNKASLNRWLLVQLKMDRLKGQHVVDRYFTALHGLNVVNDGQGLEMPIPSKISVKDLPTSYIAIAIGTAHFTKNIPLEKLSEIINALHHPVVLLGGADYLLESQTLMASVKAPVVNLVSRTNLLESAYVLNKAEVVISPDTGMMHMAAALNKKVVAIYGSTSSLLGFTPYMPLKPNGYCIIEHTNLGCRPCTKQGRATCPKSHFRCMNDLDSHEIVEKALGLIEK